MLEKIVLFLLAAVVAVPLFKRLGLGAVLGYLVAGVAIGPAALGFVEDVESTLHVAEYGVVLLLFIIGLELEPKRLWTLRRMVFGLGAGQLIGTGALLAGIAYALDFSWQESVLIGFALAMSSTALVIQLLSERRELPTRQGRAAFSILLFQDLAVIPMLAFVPLLATSGGDGGEGMDWQRTVWMLVVFAAVVLGGQYAVRPLMRMVARADIPELLTAVSLLLVLGTSWAMEAVGLSMSLGAFLAGVLLSESEFRHELQANIEPFKGLLLGLFFMAVGMSADIDALWANPLQMFGLALALLLIKGGILYVLGRMVKLPADSARALACALPQGGEFAFVLFSAAIAAGALGAEQAALLVTVVTITMLATPPMYALQAKLRKPPPKREYDDLSDAPSDPAIIIAGFGPFGQIIGRVLQVRQIPFTVLDKDSEQVDFVRRFGSRIFYGDAGRLDLLRAAGISSAKIFILTIPDMEASLQVARTVRKHYPHVRVYAMAVNRRHALLLMDMGISHVIRRGFHSSLMLSRSILRGAGLSRDEAITTVEKFREFDERALRQQQAVVHDDSLMMQSAIQAAQELEQLFEQDRAQKAGS